jgi:hypothetical protein
VGGRNIRKRALSPPCAAAQVPLAVGLWNPVLGGRKDADENESFAGRKLREWSKGSALAMNANLALLSWLLGGMGCVWQPEWIRPGRPRGGSSFTTGMGTRAALAESLCREWPPGPIVGGI